ncbi:MAG: hypothetical protein ACYC3X_30100 [Pirellulaceae bacterium]
MRKPNQSEMPLSLSRLERRFAVWRAKRRPGQRIPKSLWKSAANAATQYGPSSSRWEDLINAILGQAAIAYTTPANRAAATDAALAAFDAFDADENGQNGGTIRAELSDPENNTNGAAEATDPSGLEEKHWIDDFGWGVAQGACNTLNAVQDSLIGIGNLPAMAVNGIAFVEEKIGVLDESQTPLVRTFSLVASSHKPIHGSCYGDACRTPTRGALFGWQSELHGSNSGLAPAQPTPVRRLPQERSCLRSEMCGPLLIRWIAPRHG